MPGTNPTGFAQAPPRDRAAAVATTIFAIIVEALRAWVYGDLTAAALTDVRAQVESVLRDEFDDIKREVSGERFLAD